MLLKNYQTVAQATTALRQEGITTRLRFKNNRLVDPKTKKQFTGKQCTLLKYFRVPPGSAAGEATSVYAVLLPNEQPAYVVSNTKLNNGFQLAVFMSKMNVAVRAAS